MLTRDELSDVVANNAQSHNSYQEIMSAVDAYVEALIAAKPFVGRSAKDYSGYEESLKADLKNAIELQEQEQREEYNDGREAGLSYAIEMLHKHFG